MKRLRLLVSAFTASVATAGALLAQTPATLPESTAPTEPAASTPATTLRMQGTISAYDRDTKQLSLSTTNGEVVHFSVPDSARVRFGGRRIEQKALVTLGGYSAAVHYSASGGRTTLRSVDVFDKNERKRP